MSDELTRERVEAIRTSLHGVGLVGYFRGEEMVALCDLALTTFDAPAPAEVAPYPSRCPCANGAKPCRGDCTCALSVMSGICQSAECDQFYRAPSATLSPEVAGDDAELLAYAERTLSRADDRTVLARILAARLRSVLAEREQEARDALQAAYNLHDVMAERDAMRSRAEAAESDMAMAEAERDATREQLADHLKAKGG
jgi:hypothetical protein